MSFFSTKTFYNKSALEIGHQSYGESNLFLKLKTNYKLDIGQGHIPMLSDPFSLVLNLGDSISADHSLVRTARPQTPFSRRDPGEDLPQTPPWTWPTEWTHSPPPRCSEAGRFSMFFRYFSYYLKIEKQLRDAWGYFVGRLYSYSLPVTQLVVLISNSQWRMKELRS